MPVTINFLNPDGVTWFMISSWQPSLSREERRGSCSGAGESPGRPVARPATTRDLPGRRVVWPSWTGIRGRSLLHKHTRQMSEDMIDHRRKKYSGPRFSANMECSSRTTISTSSTTTTTTTTTTNNKGHMECSFSLQALKSSLFKMQLTERQMRQVVSLYSSIRTMLELVHFRIART